MRRPTFEAVYYGDSYELQIHIFDPVDVLGTFFGFEILKKMGPPEAPNPWVSIANLTAEQRDYTMMGIHFLLTYTLTVRGIVKPGIFSLMATPMVLKVVHEGLSPFPLLLIHLYAISS